jgi:DNA-directed RNA polymerase I, II, and III subunit RPABC5
MIIPIKCFTCGKVLADKWNYYQKKQKELVKSVNVDSLTIEDINVNSMKQNIFFDEHGTSSILDELGLKKMCCRRHMLGHVDLIELI